MFLGVFRGWPCVCMPFAPVTCCACLSVQNGNVCCSVDLECLNNNWPGQAGLCQGRKTAGVTTWRKPVHWHFIHQTITKVSKGGRCLGVAFGSCHSLWELIPAHPCRPCRVTSSTAQRNQWLLRVFSVVNYTPFLSRNLQICFSYFMGKLMLYFLF